MLSYFRNPDSYLSSFYILSLYWAFPFTAPATVRLWLISYLMLQLFSIGRHVAAVSIKFQASSSELNKDALYHFFCLQEETMA